MRSFLCSTLVLWVLSVTVTGLIEVPLLRHNATVRATLLYRGIPKRFHLFQYYRRWSSPWTTQTRAEVSYYDTALQGGISSIGEYYAVVLIGGQTFRVQVDSGSSTMAVPMVGCSTCRKNDFRYDPARSPNKDRSHAIPCQPNTCRPHTCGFDGCKVCGPNATCCSMHRPSDCGFSLRYGDGSGAEGSLMHDIMRWVPQLESPVVFGGILTDTEGFEQETVDGILGMAYPLLACNPTCTETPFDSLVRTTKIPDVFSICISESGGRMVLGAYDPAMSSSGVEYAPLSLS
uniref:Peptidase A1 domain-containing protein n=1 Tax=Compsopogon caeruleus TaxID=31354 RepID=A0A7S1XGN2_9RHOD|mmetsp:Transcript_640/g.1315  ORF Transcript_640/g.1315 Transcript_640/m.1315 type:complete len:289 (+) Transcript_640:84-950(+)